MYLDMNEMLEICNRYGIDVIDKNHPEYYKDEDFSMADIMKEPYVHIINEESIFSGTLEISISIEDDYVYCDNDTDFTCSISKDLEYSNVFSIIDKDNEIKKAA